MMDIDATSIAALPQAPKDSKANREAAAAATAFEALIIERMLTSASEAVLGDDLLGHDGQQVRELANRLRADMLAKAAPFGVARVLEQSR